jgi:hypothetical protein
MCARECDFICNQMMKNQSLNIVAYVKVSGSRRSSVPREHITGLSMCIGLLYTGGSCCSSVLQDQQLQVMFCVCVVSVMCYCLSVYVKIRTCILIQDGSPSFKYNVFIGSHLV